MMLVAFDPSPTLATYPVALTTLQEVVSGIKPAAEA